VVSSEPLGFGWPLLLHAIYLLRLEPPAFTEGVLVWRCVRGVIPDTMPR